MSLNYPNREAWLKVRRTPRKNPPGRFIHVSTDYRWMRPVLPSLIPGGTPHLGEPVFRKMAPGKTYRR